MNDLDAATDTIREPEDPSVFTSSAGLKLRIKKVSPFIIAEARRKLRAPRVPSVFNEDKGRNEENPNDPDYLEAVQNYQFDASMLAQRVYFILGTEVVSVPKGMHTYDSPMWADEILAAYDELDIPAEGPRRYHAWLKFYAIPSDEDQGLLLRAILNLGGATMEADVQQAQKSFRPPEERDTSDGVSATDSGARGDISATNGVGYSTGVRGEGSSGLRALPVEPVDRTELV